MTQTPESPVWSVGMILFPNLTQLDLTAPYEVFARLPGARVSLVAATLEPVRSERGLTIAPDATFDTAPHLDVVCVPGGPGVDAMMEDDALLAFLGERAPRARYVTSVCTGALLLGAAGLLRGYRATTHWLSHDLLALFGAQPVHGRVVVDRSRITGGGITAGLDFALTVAAEMFGASAAQQIQLMLEYDPAPPFASGTPETAPTDVVRAVTGVRRGAQARRRAIAERAAARLAALDPRGSGGQPAGVEPAWFETRRARPADAAAIALAHRDSIGTIGPRFYAPEVVEAWGSGLAPELYVRAMEDGEAFFIAVGAVDGAPAVLGFATHRADDAQDGASVYVRGSVARRGIGTALLWLAERHAVERGATSLHIQASLAGVPFYSANGFEELGRGEAALLSGRSMPCVFMRKRLTASPD